MTSVDRHNAPEELDTIDTPNDAQEEAVVEEQTGSSDQNTDSTDQTPDALVDSSLGLDRETFKAIIETILFVADGPVGPERFVELFGKRNTSVEEIVDRLRELADDYADKTFALVEVAEGWRIQTRSDYAEWVTSFFKMERGQRLGRAALEALAIIAYRQPITRAEVDEIRGVDSGAALRGLVEKALVKAMGRRKSPGRPMMYGTTKRFLEYFGLAKLSDLPTMDEFGEDFADALPPEIPQESLALEYDGQAQAPVEDIEETETDHLEDTESTDAMSDAEDDQQATPANNDHNEIDDQEEDTQ